LRLAILFAVAVSVSAANLSTSSAEPMHIMKPQSSAASSQPGRQSSEARPAQAGQLVYHGGTLLPRPHLYAIYWGSAAGFPSDFIEGMNDFLGAYGGTRYTAIMTQYLAPLEYPPVLPVFDPSIDAWQDTSRPAPRGQVRLIGKEACKFAETAGGGPDPNGVYVVMTSNYPHAKYCAWHSFWNCNGTIFPIIYLPNLNRVRGCDLGPLAVPGATNPYSEGVRSDSNAAAHELSEVVRDPFFDGWKDARGNDIGDQCSFEFSNPVSLNDSYTWQIQELWSNSDQACIQSK
jgi:hypothetical protein